MAAAVRLVRDPLIAIQDIHLPSACCTYPYSEAHQKDRCLVPPRVLHFLTQKIGRLPSLWMKDAELVWGPKGSWFAVLRGASRTHGGKD
jgi:hypothetical protein